MDTQDRTTANSRVVKRLAFAAVLMFGFGFALVPLYDVFCEVTGLNGKDRPDGERRGTEPGSG